MNAILAILQGKEEKVSPQPGGAGGGGGGGGGGY